LSSTQPLLTPTTTSRFLSPSASTRFSDWIEEDDPQRRHKPALYLDGQWAVSFRALGEFGVLIWEVDGNVAAIRHIGEVTSIGG
jgi:hypothetical protein